jgi:K+-transporting ATPase ATPase C chain
MKKILITSVIMLVIFTVLTGLIYPVVVWGIAKLIFPKQAEGSLITKNGTVIGSKLIAQKFEKPEYFHPRPSAMDPDYNVNTSNAVSSGGSNLAPSNPDLVTAVMKRLDDEKKANPDSTGIMPDDMLTASASGLDPEITKADAIWQSPRVAKARKVDEKIVTAAIDKFTEKPWLGFIGPERVNVLELNIYLDDSLK